jgi:hypothetical protein
MFALEGFVPVAVFYAGWRVGGLAAGIVASSATTGLVVLWQQRRGRDVALTTGHRCVHCDSIARGDGNA